MCGILVCDGLSGLPDAVGMVWPQRCPPDQGQLPLRLPPGLDRHRQGPQADLHAPTEAAAHDRLAEFIRLWEAAWAEFVPFLSFAPDVREVIYTTNSGESVNARIRRVVKARGHFPTETAALKCVYLALMSLDATGTAKKRWNNRWKAALNAFSVAFSGTYNHHPK